METSREQKNMQLCVQRLVKLRRTRQAVDLSLEILTSNEIKKIEPAEFNGIVALCLNELSRSNIDDDSVKSLYRLTKILQKKYGTLHEMPFEYFQQLYSFQSLCY